MLKVLILALCALQFNPVFLSLPKTPVQFFIQKYLIYLLKDFNEQLPEDQQTITTIIDNALPINLTNYKTLNSLSNLSYHIHSSNQIVYPQIYLNSPSFSFSQKAVNYNFQLKFQEEQKVMDVITDPLGEQIFIVTNKLNIFKISQFNQEDTAKTQTIKMCTARTPDNISIQEEYAQFVSYQDQLLIVMSKNYFMFCTVKTISEGLLISKEQINEKSYPVSFYQDLIFVPVGSDGINIYEFYQGQLRYESTYSCPQCDIRQVHFLEKEKIIFVDYNYGIRQLTFTANKYPSGEQQLINFQLSKTVYLEKFGIQFFSLDKTFMVIAGTNKDDTSFTNQYLADFQKNEFNLLSEFKGHKLNIQGISLLPEFLFAWTDDKFMSSKRAFRYNSDNLEDSFNFELKNLQTVKTFKSYESSYVIFLINDENQQLRLFEIKQHESAEIALPLENELKKQLQNNNNSIIDFTFWTKNCTKKNLDRFASEFSFCEVKQSIKVTLNSDISVQTTNRHIKQTDYSFIIKLLAFLIVCLLIIFIIYLVCTQFETKPIGQEQEIEYGMASAETAF